MPPLPVHQLSEPIFRALFESTPGLFVALTPDDFRIVAVTDHYLALTRRKREDLLGKVFFDVFPDDPRNPEASGTANLRASLARVKKSLLRDAMAVQKHPIVNPDTGQLEDRYWTPLNSPVLDEQGKLMLLVHSTQDVTEYVRNLVTPAQDQPARDELNVLIQARELKRLSAQLLESEQRLQAIFRDAALGIAATDLDGNITDANAAYCRMLGYTLDELKQRNVLDFTHPQDRSRNLELREELMSGERPNFVYEKRYITKGGETIWSRISASLLRTSEGRITNLIAIAEDITAQKEAEARLREARTLERIGGRIAKLGGWVVDYQNERRVIWADEVYKIFEYEGDSPPHISELLKLIPTANAQEFQRALADCEHKGRPFDLELPLTSFGGTAKWIRIAGEPELDKDGKVLKTLGALQDITRRKAEQQRIAESEQRLKYVTQATLDVVWDVDLVNWKIWFNDGLKKYGYEIGDELQDTRFWVEKIHPDDRAAVIQGLQALVAGTGTEWSKKYRLRTAKGAWAHIEDRGYIIRDANGKGLRMVGGSTDITRRLEMEEQLLQSQRLESVGQLTGGIAHDFNNLLTVILGNAQLLHEMLQDDPRLSALTSIIDVAATRGANLTRHLLAFSRKQALQPETVAIDTLLRNLKGMLSRTLGENIIIQLHCESTLWPALVDPNQLEVALLNLCINARDAMPEGGFVTIETRDITLDEVFSLTHSDVQPGDYILISISDTGCGIPPDILDHVFEPFFTTKGKGKGTGLGLSTVFGFIKQSNGHINIYSEVGRGTTIKIYLPRSVGEEQDQFTQSYPNRIKGGKERVLMVEDNELVRKFGRDLLQALGYQVVTASDATAALTHLREQADFDLLFTDVVMPGMGGHELARKALAIFPKLKVLYTSGYTQDAMIHNGKLDKGVHLLEKPYNKASLAIKIREVLDSPENGNTNP